MRPEMMGDAILMTPIISAIKTKLPDSQISLLTKSGIEDVYKNNDDVFETINFKENMNIVEFVSFSKVLRDKKFDVAIIPEDNPRPNLALLALLANIPKRIGDKSRILYGWVYNHGVWINSADHTKHHVELYLELLKPLGIENIKPPSKIVVDQNAKEKIEILLQNFHGKKLAGIHIGTGGGNRALLPSVYKEIGKRLNTLGFEIVFIGGEKEANQLDEIRNNIDYQFLDMVNKLSMQELFALISKLSIFVGVDSGPMHSAATLKIPIVAIYTAKDVNPARWLPWRGDRPANYIAIESKKNCDLQCDHRKCKLDLCVKEIDIEKIVEWVKTIS